MEIGDVAVATITWARSADEEALLRRSLRVLAGAGLPVAVADTGVNASFEQFLSTLPGFTVTVPTERGLVRQIQDSISVAATFARPFVLYVEPDKEMFFGPRMSRFLEKAPADSGVGVVLASRSNDSFETFPPLQRYTEGVINRLCAQATGVDGDYSYGPFLMNRVLLRHVAILDPRLGWGWRHFIFKAAHADGLRVMHVSDEYPCPPDHRREDDDERKHRMRQLSQNILGLIE